MGLIFMVGTIIVFSLSETFEFSMYAAGVSALLAWVPIILVPDRKWAQHLQGLCAYLIIGGFLTFLSYHMTPHIWLRLLSMMLVTFCGYMMLLRGIHWFLVAWCLVYWYLLVPLFIGDDPLAPVLTGHLIGSALVVGLNLMKPVWLKATKSTVTAKDNADEQNENQPEVGFVVRFAIIVSLSVTTGLAIGIKWLTTDPTLIANATINMISPTLRQTWQAGVERIILGSIGLVAGFYFGWFFPEPWVANVVAIVFSFLSLAVIYVSIGMVVGLLFFLISYSWGAMNSDLGHLIANEKLIGEFLGVIIAIVAIYLLVRFSRQSDTSTS